MSSCAIPRQGEILAGKYRVEHVLGVGGMGTVIAAHHIELDQCVALKLMHAHAMFDADARARFSREAKAAARLRGEHVARVLDVDRLDNGVPFIVMEMLEGQDLRAVLRDRKKLPVADAVRFILHAIEGLAEAHSLGIVHRDVKLRNLFLTKRPDGRPIVKVLDFGIAKHVAGGALDDEQTQGSSMLGSPQYMAPEQMRSAKDIDARADVWALGVCLFLLLAGEFPFEGDTVTAVCAAVLSQPPRPLLSLRPDAPTELAVVFARALEKDPAQRFASVAELAFALEPFAAAADRGAFERASLLLGVKAAPPLTPLTPRAKLPKPGAFGDTVANAATTVEGARRRSASAPSRLTATLLVAGGFAATGVVLWGLGLAHARTSRAASSGYVGAPPTAASATTLGGDPPAPSAGNVVVDAAFGEDALAATPLWIRQAPFVSPRRCR